MIEYILQKTKSEPVRTHVEVKCARPLEHIFKITFFPGISKKSVLAKTLFCVGDALGILTISDKNKVSYGS